MSEELWVGKSTDFGYIVYDPSVQDDESDNVLLYTVDAKELRRFNREKTRGQLKPAKNEAKALQCIESYRAWKNRLGATNEPSDDSAKPDDQESLDETIAERLEQQLLPVLQSTQEQLTAREHEIEALKAEVASLGSELAGKNTRLASAAAKLSKLEKQQTTQDVDQLELLSRQAALYASGGDSTFRKILSAHKLDGQLPLVLATSLETRLRKGLKELDPAYRLFDLIKIAKENEVLDEIGVDMAHTFRRQRNRIAHDDYSKAEATAIILLALYAASILWPRLPEW